ncbi:Ubiquinone biosynthesis O-methyltransferase [Candidatus Tiddalikarchaeum anstoanum]|nr:Ubiquinone biosynthesis O-methyltransferase [Candidatus Tiddalikarchaeum anstoanum]
MKKFSAKKVYNKIAKNYHDSRTSKKSESWFFNNCLEMPNTLKLLGNVKRKRILDLGCGTGIYAKILAKKGAKVEGIDISEKEIDIARIENPKISFQVGSVEVLPYKNNSFDIVLSALVLEYLKNWTKVLSEVRRVLVKGGYFIFSLHNPVSACIKIKNNKVRVYDYFNVSKIETKWPKSLKSVKMVWYNKTIGSIVKLLVKNGFILVDYDDARPLPKAKTLFPKEYASAAKRPYFCTWKWRKL